PTACRELAPRIARARDRVSWVASAPASWCGPNALGVDLAGRPPSSTALRACGQRHAPGLATQRARGAHRTARPKPRGLPESSPSAPLVFALPLRASPPLPRVGGGGGPGGAPPHPPPGTPTPPPPDTPAPARRSPPEKNPPPR